MMGQSIRTSKSARPGTITYVPIDKSEFRSTVSSDKKKNKIMKIVVMLIVMILVMSCCVYAGISYYYSYHFFLGTTINGIDSSNKTAYEVEQEIAGKKDNYVIQVSARMQEPQTITGKDIDYQYVSSGEILQLLKTQKPWEWIRGFFETKNYMVQEETVFSREKLEEQVSSLNCAKKENQIAPENAYVSFSNSEFTIVPETEGSELNAREAYQMISGLSSAYFYPQLFIFYYNYRVYIFKAEDNYYLTPQILANSSSSSIHSAASDISTLLFSIAVFNISIDGDAYIRVV